jgi:hypothetical protein
MKKKTLIALAKSKADWQEENANLLHKIGGWNPQFFPQGSCAVFGHGEYALVADCELAFEADAERPQE